MSPHAASYPVSANAVYVWRGFKPSTLSYADFTGFLGTVFVPACVLLQPAIGLRAYLPALVPQSGKPAAVPDQTALMFWNTATAHDEAKAAIAERIYLNLHGDVYDMARSKLPEVPIALDPAATTLVPEQPYFLVPQPADWMHGATRHLVAARPAALAAADFLIAAARWAKNFQLTAGEVDGALLCCGNDYLVVWLHSGGNAAAAQIATTGLAAKVDVLLNVEAVPHALQAELWDDWPGLDLSLAPCLNLQFARHPHALPRKRSRP